jgi:hypothetical protein
MRLVLLHLSDLHFRADAAGNPLAARSSHIRAAVQAIAPSARACLILITGDIAYSGQPPEYVLARNFLTSLRSGLTQEYGPDSVHLLAVPGNHDCDFGQDTAARKAILASQATASPDVSILEICTATQDPFFDFANAHTNTSTAPWHRTSLHHVLDFDFDGFLIRCHLLNTAWSSSQTEQPGALILPTAQLAFSKAISKPSNLSITLMHHPYGWLEPSSAKALRSTLEAHSDMILTGHEHDPTLFRKVTNTGTANEYTEGGVLQDPNDPSHSSFNVIVIETDGNQEECRTLQWIPEGRYATLTPATPQPLATNPAAQRNLPRLSQQMREYLSDPGATYTHPLKHTLALSDIYIYPNLRELRNDTRDQHSLISGRDAILTHVVAHQHILVIGPDKSGKTALAKTLFADFHTQGKFPLFIEPTAIRTSNPKRVLKALDAVVTQAYDNTTPEAYWQLDKDSRIAIVDDYDDIARKLEDRNEFLSDILSRFGTVVLIGGEETRYEEIDSCSTGSAHACSFHHLEIMPFGYLLRHKLVERWQTLGQPAPDPQHLQTSIKTTEKLIDKMLGKDLLPSYPVYLLIVLQTLESANRPNTSAGSTGYLYEVLITTCLARSCSNVMELDARQNYLSELAFHLYRNSYESISDEEALAWHSQYTADYRITFAYANIRDALAAADLLVHKNGRIAFRYKYIYCYCVGRYFRDHIGEAEIIAHVERLSQRLYHDDSANIIVFLCHLSKDPRIIEHVIRTAESLFSDTPPTQFTDDLAYLDKLPSEAPRFQIENSNPSDNRLRALEQQDNANVHPAPPAEPSGTSTPPSEDQAVAIKKGSQVNAGFKTIQILGQILRNFYGSLRGDRKIQLAETCFSLAFRELADLYRIILDDKEGIVAATTQALMEEHPDMLPEVARLRSGQQLFVLTEMLTLSMLKHVSDSVGMRELSETFQQVFANHTEAPYRLLDLSIKLDHYESFPTNETLRLAKDLHKNPFGICLVRHMVWLHFYLFPTDYRLRQSISAQLDFGSKQEVFLDSRVKKTKGH